MTGFRGPLAVPAAVVSGVLGVALIATSWVLLFTSSKSPLRAHEPAYVDGFAMGIFFMFFQLIGVAYSAGALATFRRRHLSAKPAP